MRNIGLALIAAAALASAANAQQQQPTFTVEQRIGAEVGPIITAAALRAQRIEQLEALVSQRDKTISDLQKQLDEFKAKEAPK